MARGGTPELRRDQRPVPSMLTVIYTALKGSDLNNSSTAQRDYTIVRSSKSRVLRRRVSLSESSVSMGENRDLGGGPPQNGGFCPIQKPNK